MRTFLVLVVLLCWCSGCTTVRADVVPMSGRIEGDEATVAARTGGRVREITVREGDTVQAGQLLAVLDDGEVRARERQAQAALEQAAARVHSSEEQIALLQEQLAQSRLNIEQARLDSRGRVGEAEQAIAAQHAALTRIRLEAEQARQDVEGRVRQAAQQVAAAEALLVQSRAEHQQAADDARRYDALLSEREVSVQLAEQMRTREKTTAAQVLAARKQLDAARGNLTAARAGLLTPRVRSAQAEAIRHQIRQAEFNLTTARALVANPQLRSLQEAAVRRQIAQARADLGGAQAATRQAAARLAETHAARTELEVHAPFSGTIVTRVAEPGEVVVSGSPLLTMLDLRQIYMRAFVPEGDIGRVKLHQAARVYLDSAPKEGLDAEVGRIDPQLSFTPENTYFRSDRVKQVVGVKLYLKNPRGDAKPGMPADAEVLTGDSAR